MGMDLVDQHYVQRGYLLGDQTGGQMNDGNITCDTCGGVFSAVRQMRGHACSGNPTPQQPGPREWWIEDIEANRTVPAEQAKHRYLLVVERSALTACEAKLAEMTERARILNQAVDHANMVADINIKERDQERTRADGLMRLQAQSIVELFAARAEVTHLRERLFKQTSEKILTKFAGLFKKLRDGGD